MAYRDPYTHSGEPTRLACLLPRALTDLLIPPSSPFLLHLRLPLSFFPPSLSSSQTLPSDPKIRIRDTRTTRMEATVKLGRLEVSRARTKQGRRSTLLPNRLECWVNGGSRTEGNSSQGYVHCFLFYPGSRRWGAGLWKVGQSELKSMQAVRAHLPSSLPLSFLSFPSREEVAAPLVAA